MRNTTLCHIEKDGKYLMIRRNKKQNDLNHDKYIAPGGKIEDKESPEQANRREVKEETGLTLINANYRGIVTSVSDIWETEYMHIFTSDSFDGHITECDEGELVWVDKQELLTLQIWKGDKIFLKLINDPLYPFFSLRLEYKGETLISAILNEKALDLGGI
ncbi:MAG: 8-oxo-dGTP diphosphatase [Clostridia bacterium]|nr:8-oxo-dGTP diphosphatase [Clostridia bacterium]